jgi:phosphoglycerate dehydrogenase-like enzyme
MRTMIITQKIQPHLLEEIKELAPDWEILAGTDKETWKSRLTEAEIIAGWQKGMEEAVLSDDANLKWVQTWSAGVNSLPLAELDKKNIDVTSSNGVHAYPISETIFALMLGLTRKIHSYVRNQEKKVWHHANLNLEMHEKTIGIIGVGAIGTETAKIAKAFGMKVLGVRYSGKPAENVDEMFTADQLELLLPECDYVVVTLPLTENTRHLFGAAQFQQMKRTSFFINIGRGEIVVEEDLISALQEGIISGAGLDVFTKEPLEKESPLWEMDNVIITPHTSGSTEHYDRRVIEDIFLPNLKTYLSGKAPAINLVDFSKGY